MESLAKLFDRTQAQNNELTRTKHKRGVTDHDPELLDNYKLLNDVKVKLEKERRALEEVKEKIARHEERFKQQNVPDNESGEVPMAGPARAYQSTDFVTAPEPEEEEPNSKMIYIDPGNHWCEKCDIFFHKISDYLDHLQTEDHWRVIASAGVLKAQRFKPFLCRKCLDSKISLGDQNQDLNLILRMQLLLSSKVRYRLV